jgi:hypothetical protein
MATLSVIHIAEDLHENTEPGFWQKKKQKTPFPFFCPFRHLRRNSAPRAKKFRAKGFFLFS